jgi:hypothetical protein
MDQVRTIFLRWERLRLPYNIILLAATAGFHGWLLKLLPDYPILLLPLGFACLGANLCFFAAPAVESYLAWLGLRSRWVGPVLFAGGVAISLPLVFLFPLFLRN